MDILGSILSVASGGITGIIGTVTQSVFQYKSKQLDLQLEKQKDDHDLEQRKLDIQLQAAEAATALKVTEVQTSGEVDKADAATLAASYQLEPQEYSNKATITSGQNWVFVVLDFMRGIVRPGLTIYLCAITTLIYIQTRGLINTDHTDSFALLEKLVDTILYLTTSCVLFWFGSRNKSK